MPGFTERQRAIELVLLLATSACQQSPSSEKKPPPRAASSAVSSASVTPRPASSFECQADSCLQKHPRLPDTGEWRCAEQGHVVWCAGGEPAAGVVSGPPDPSYRCGRRWGKARQERVCIDRHPDYPGAGHDFACRFEQERGIARKCVAARSEPSRPLPEQAVPGCWVKQDCASQRCDRGTCSCANDADCEVGRCQQGSCVEVRR